MSSPRHFIRWLWALGLTHVLGLVLLAWSQPAGFFSTADAAARSAAFLRLHRVWQAAWICWALGDLCTLPFLRHYLHLATGRHRCLLAHLTSILMRLAVGCDLALNLFFAFYYSFRFDPHWIPYDPWWRLLTMGLANGLFSAAYLALALLLYVHSPQPRSLTHHGLGAALCGLGLAALSLRPPSPLLQWSAVLFAALFLTWLVRLYRHYRFFRGAPLSSRVERYTGIPHAP